ncbi:hypothetical protein CMU93_00280 [Elizabethkingia anophelis]|nr:hypothetical protein [Elizabethkingia anophelis]
MINNKVIYAVLGFFILFSCNSPSSEEQSKTFDIPLLEKNEELRRTADHIAITRLNKSYLEIARKNNYSEGRALCYINMANVNLSMGSYKNAQLLLKKAESILSTSDNKIIKTRLYQDYALLSGMLRFYEHGLGYNAKAMYYVKKIKPSKVKNFLLARTYYDRGDLLNENKQHDSALVYLHKALRIKDKPLYESAIAKHHMRYTHNMDSASIYIQRTQDLLKTRSKKNAQYTFVYYTIGNYYDTLDDYPKAESAYKKVLSVGAETNDSYYFFNQYVYKALANIYKKTGRAEEEHRYLHLYISAKEDIDDQQHEVANLTVKNFISGITEGENERQKNYLVYIAVFISLIIAIGIYIYKKIQTLKHRKEVLANEKESLKYETELLKTKVHDKSFDEVIDLAKRNDSTFLTRFREVYPGFINKLLEINPDLENSELILCAMLKLNFSSKEISNYLFIQHKSAQQKKSRIRKRLNLPSDADLYLFFGDLN